MDWGEVLEKYRSMEDFQSVLDGVTPTQPDGFEVEPPTMWLRLIAKLRAFLRRR